MIYKSKLEIWSVRISKTIIIVENEILHIIFIYSCHSSYEFLLMPKNFFSSSWHLWHFIRWRDDHDSSWLHGRWSTCLKWRESHLNNNSHGKHTILIYLWSIRPLKVHTLYKANNIHLISHDRNIFSFISNGIQFVFHKTFYIFTSWCFVSIKDEIIKRSDMILLCMFSPSVATLCEQLEDYLQPEVSLIEPALLCWQTSGYPQVHMVSLKL